MYLFNIMYCICLISVMLNYNREQHNKYKWLIAFYVHTTPIEDLRDSISPGYSREKDIILPGRQYYFYGVGFALTYSTGV